MQSMTPAAGQDRNQGHNRHHCGTKHAGLRSNDDNEGTEGSGRRRHAQHQPSPQQRGHEQDGSDHDGRVAPRHGRQMR